MMRNSRWYRRIALLLTTIVGVVLLPATAWAHGPAGGAVTELARRRPRAIRGAGLLGTLCCLAVVGVILLVVLLITRRRRSR
jgi:hypothetical protein